MTLLRTWKATYLVAVVANALVSFWFPRGQPVYWNDALLFGANVASWMLFRRRMPVGYASERLLSLGRMGMIAAVASVEGMILIVFSGVAFVVWVPLFELGSRPRPFWLIWVGCAILLTVEVLYFRALKRDWDRLAAESN